MSSWLQKQRKGELMDLADQAGMQGATITMRKDELVFALDQHLHANASSLSQTPAFHDFYHRVRSPIKKEAFATASISAASAPVTSAVKSIIKRARRVSKFPSSEPDLETSPEPPTSILSRADRALQDVATNLSLPMPPSPSAVTDLVERQTTLASAQVHRYWLRLSVSQHLATARSAASTILAVETIFLLAEAWGLQRATLPWRYAFSLPASGLTRGNPLPLYFPDFFALLTPAFWGPTTLWVMTSLALPMALGWLFNFGLVLGRGRQGGYDVDPLIFNVGKALVTWLVYAQGLRFRGLLADSTVYIVQRAVPGGWIGIVVGAGIGAVISLYEAILRS